MECDDSIRGSLPGFKRSMSGAGEVEHGPSTFKPTLYTSNSELNRFKGSLDKRSFSTRVDLYPMMD